MKNIKNNKLIKTCFWILLIYSLIIIIVTFFRYPYFFQIKNVFSPLNDVYVNLTLDKKISNKPLFCFGDYCSDLASHNNTTVYNVEFSPLESGIDFYLKPVDKYYIVYPYEKRSEFLDSFSDLYLYSGNNKYYFSKEDLLKAKTSTAEIKFDYSTKDDVLKYYKIELEGVKPNYNGKFNHFIVFVLNLFFNCKYFIFPYLGLLGCFLIYSFYLREEFSKVFLNKKFIYPFLFCALLISGIVLRIYNISNLPLYPDEIYTKTIAIENFKSCFSDPGNPPLFFILEFLFCKIFNYSDFALRFLPFLFGVGFIFAVYFFFLKINKNLALLMMFFASFNTINIVYSQSARCYSLCMLMCVLISYFLLKYLKDFKFKNFLIFVILSICAINTHYLLAIYVFSNFVYGSIVLIYKKCNIFKFIFANLFCFLTFSPYLLISFKNAINKDFNSWIKPLDLSCGVDIINAFFINKEIFLIIAFVVLVNLILIFINKFKVNSYKKEVFIYLLFSIVFCILIASMISIFVKPILDKRILLSLYGLFVLFAGMLIASVVDFDSGKNIIYFLKNSYLFLLLMLFFSITQGGNFKITHNLNNYFFFIKNDSVKYDESKYEIHGLITQDLKFLNNFSDINEINKINWHVVYGLGNKQIEKITKKELSKTDKKVVLYLNNYATTLDSSYFIEKQIKIYNTGANKNAKVVLE